MGEEWANNRPSQQINMTSSPLHTQSHACSPSSHCTDPQQDMCAVSGLCRQYSPLLLKHRLSHVNDQPKPTKARFNVALFHHFTSSIANPYGRIYTHSSPARGVKFMNNSDQNWSLKDRQCMALLSSLKKCRQVHGLIDEQWHGTGRMFSHGY